MSQMLREDEVSLERIEMLAKQAFITTDHDSDGDLIFGDDGVKTFVTVDKDRKMITFFMVWPLNSSFGIEEKLEYVNQLSNDTILVRFAVPKPGMLWCDYQFLYEGGISPVNIIRTYRRFLSICKAVAAKENKGIIGLD